MQSEQLNEQIPADADKRGFEGIWIPAEIWLDTNLCALERMLYAEIASFGKKGCWKKSDELMKLLGVSKGTFQKYCRNLRDGGYIDEKRVFGRIVRTTTLGFRPSNQETHRSNNCAVQQHNECAIHQHNDCAVLKEYTKEYSDNKLSLDSRPVEKSEKQEYGNKDVNELFRYWQEQVGTPPSNNKANRNACATLIRQRGLENAKKTVLCIGKAVRSQDRFAPNIASFTELYGAYGKLAKLDAWIIKNSPKTALKRYEVANTADYEPSDEERAETLKRMKEVRRQLFK